MKKGFTLLELMCSLFIVLLICFSFNFKIYNNILLEYSKNILISDLKLSKIMAYSKGKEVTLVFIKDLKSKDFIGYSITCDLKSFKKVYLPNNIVISNRDSSIPQNGILTFNANGSVSPHACSIVLTNKKINHNKKITLTIGFTRITEK